MDIVNCIVMVTCELSIGVEMEFATFLFLRKVTCAVLGKGRGKIAGASPSGERMCWERQKCMFCAGCVPLCDIGALTVTETCLELDASICNCCGECAGGCPTGALALNGRNGDI